MICDNLSHLSVCELMHLFISILQGTVVSHSFFPFSSPRLGNLQRCYVLRPNPISFSFLLQSLHPLLGPMSSQDFWFRLPHNFCLSCTSLRRPLNFCYLLFLSRKLTPDPEASDTPTWAPTLPVPLPPFVHDDGWITGNNPQKRTLCPTFYSIIEFLPPYFYFHRRTNLS